MKKVVDNKREISDPTKIGIISSLATLGGLVGAGLTYRNLSNKLDPHSSREIKINTSDYNKYLKGEHTKYLNRASLGAGLATTAGLGGYHVYEYLKGRKDPEVTRKQLFNKLGKDALLGLGIGTTTKLVGNKLILGDTNKDNSGVIKITLGDINKSNKSAAKDIVALSGLAGTGLGLGKVIYDDLKPSKPKSKKSGIFVKKYSDTNKKPESKGSRKIINSKTIPHLGGLIGISSYLIPKGIGLYKDRNSRVGFNGDSYISNLEDNYNKLSKRAALGSGIATSIYLGSKDIKDYLKNKKDPKNRITGKQLAKNLGKSSLVGLGVGTMTGLGVKGLGKLHKYKALKDLPVKSIQSLHRTKSDDLEDLLISGSGSMIGSGLVGIGSMAGLSNLRKRSKYKKDESRDKET